MDDINDINAKLTGEVGEYAGDVGLYACRTHEEQHLSGKAQEELDESENELTGDVGE